MDGEEIFNVLCGQPDRTGIGRDQVCNDMDFLHHFWKLLSLRSIEAIVTVRRKIECSRYEDNSADRKRLATDCYHRVLGRRANFDLYQEDEERRERLA